LRAGTGLHGIGPFVPGSAQGAKRRHQLRPRPPGRSGGAGGGRGAGRGAAAARTRRAWNAHLLLAEQQHEARGVRRQTRSRAPSSAHAGAERV
jgi:hypothetical protein